jgi:hypothetical protein
MAKFVERQTSSMLVNSGAKGDTIRKQCENVQTRRPRWLRSLPSVYPATPYFMCCHADSAVYNAFHACRQACDDSAEYNGLYRVVAC